MEAVSGDEIPRDIQELQFRVFKIAENITADLICDFTVIDTEDLELSVLFHHPDDTVCHYSWQLVVTEIEGEQAVQLHDSLNEVLGHVVGDDLKLFHFDILDATVLVAK